MRKIILSLVLVMLVSFSLLVSPIGAVVEERNTNIQAIYSTYGTLSTTTGPSITEMELYTLLNHYIPTTHSQSRLIVLTQCYGGDTMQPLQGQPETTILSATSPGQQAYYGGYDDDAAKALKPGANWTSDHVHNAGVAGKDPKESPQKDGPVTSLEPTNPEGPIKSRHVLVYAGQPDGSPGRDNDQRDTIKNNFQGQQNTTVTTVGGTSGGGWDYPGSFNGLQNALKNISNNMNEDEQFILFVTDHGDLHKALIKHVVLPDQYNEISINLPEDVYAQMIQDPDNQPDFSFITYNASELYIEGIIVNDREYYEYEQYEMDINGDEITDYYKYVYLLEEEYLYAGENYIMFFCYNNFKIEVIMSIGTGDIQKGSPPICFIGILHI